MAEETEQGTPVPQAATPQPAPAAPAAPPSRSVDEILREPHLTRAAEPVRDAIIGAREFAGEITLIVQRERIRDVCQAFKNDGYNYLVDLAGVDYSTFPAHAAERFAVSYHLYSFSKNRRVRLKLFVSLDATVPSVTPVWKTANWHERETFDMFGIVFTEHPNLERILMWDGFNGHPLRKDFPIRGIDTGARIYPEIFPEGGGPKPGSTGKDPKDVNLWNAPTFPFGRAPVSPPPGVLSPVKPVAAPAAKPVLPAAGVATAAPAAAAGVATVAPMAAPTGSVDNKKVAPPPNLETAVPTEAAPWHDPGLALPERMELAQGKGLKDKLFAAMAQTDCTACGWDCEGYADALDKEETTDITLCVPGEAETEEMLTKLMKEAGKL